MGRERYEHWGVIVRPGKTVKCDPGKFYCHISQIALHHSERNEDVHVFVKVDGKEFLIGTLSVDKYPHFATDLVFEKEFELLHTSKTTNISALGFKCSKGERKSNNDTRTEEDEEVPLAIPLYPHPEDKSKESKSVEKLGATKSSEPNISLEETNKPGMKVHDGLDDDDESDEDYADSEEGESSDDEDPSDDDDDSESSDEEGDEVSPKITEGKNRPAETPLKKAKIATPSMGNETDSGSAKRRGYVHFATPYPSSKQVKKTPSHRQL